ncbi:STAS domain-containing protein [bacterium]|nr:STAS domain-containing protein [bacterium]
MNIDFKNSGKWVIAGFSGRIDGHTSPDCEQALKDKIGEGNHLIAIDLSDVDYMSSAGLRVLLATYKNLKANTGDMALISPQESVAEVLDISGFSSIFKIVNKIEELG